MCELALETWVSFLSGRATQWVSTQPIHDSLVLDVITKEVIDAPLWSMIFHEDIIAKAMKEVKMKADS